MAGAEIKNVLREELFPGNSAAFDAVNDYIAQGNITAFTGAGVSTPLFPTWTGLLLQWLRDEGNARLGSRSHSKGRR
jgi:hypothetical protein